MPLLFSYGTLRDEQVQLSVFGRTLVGHQDCLLGYEQTLTHVADPAFVRMSGNARHSILKPASDGAAQVAGTALEVTEAELALADRYEPVEYRRVMAKLASGRQTWVYVDAQFDPHIQRR